MFNLADIKQNKKYTDYSRVLGIIYEQGPVSRAELKRLTGLTQTTLVRNVNELIHTGYVHDDIQGESSGGRKPGLLSVNPGAGYTIGIDIARIYTRVALLDLECNIIRSDVFGMFQGSTPENTVRKVAAIISDFCIGIDRRKILGIGVGTVGPIDREKGIILNPVHFPAEGWKDVPIRQMIRDNTGLTAIVEAGERAAAYGEYRNGYHRKYLNVAHVTAGMGLRLGIIANGCLIRGSCGSDAGFGHIRIEREGSPCYCGNTGCLESYVAIPILLGKLKNEIENGRKTAVTGMVQYYFPDINFDILCKAVDEGDELATEIVDEAAGYFAAGLAILAGILTPEMIVLGGPLIQKCGRFYSKSVEMAMKRICGNADTALTDFSKGILEENAVVIGMGNLVLDNLLK